MAKQYKIKDKIKESKRQYFRYGRLRQQNILREFEVRSDLSKVKDMTTRKRLLQRQKQLKQRIKEQGTAQNKYRVEWREHERMLKDLR